MRRRELMLGVVGLCLWGQAIAVLAEDKRISVALAPEDARSFVSRLAEETLQVLRSREDVAARAGQLAPLLRQGLDLPAMGQFVLGRQGRTMTPQQSASFARAFEKNVVETYSDLLARQTVADVHITGEAKQPDGDVIVTSQITRPSGPATPYDWRVRETGEGLKVVDVIINGVSLLITRRQEFASVMRKDGVDGLIRRLEAGQAS